MMAVAGLAMHAGYHDSHVGVTKRIVRFLRQWRKDRKALKRRQEVETGHYDTDVHLNVRAVSPALSAVTDGHKEQHAMASFRAAVVSSRVRLSFSVSKRIVAYSESLLAATGLLRSPPRDGYRNLPVCIIPNFSCRNYTCSWSRNCSCDCCTVVTHPVTPAQPLACSKDPRWECINRFHKIEGSDCHIISTYDPIIHNIQTTLGLLRCFNHKDLST